jgi:hypothetical protein
MAEKTASCTAKVKFEVEVSWPFTLQMGAPVQQLHDTAHRECLAILNDVRVQSRAAIRIVGTPKVHMITYSAGDESGT